MQTTSKQTRIFTVFSIQIYAQAYACFVKFMHDIIYEMHSITYEFVCRKKNAHTI